VVSSQSPAYEAPCEDDFSHSEPKKEIAALPCVQENCEPEPAPAPVDDRPRHIVILEEQGGGGRLVWDLRGWFVVWGDRYNFLRVKVLNTGEATYEYQNDLRHASGVYEKDVVASLISELPK
jgi:hypothetical protein